MAGGALELCLIAEDTNQYGSDRRDGTSLAGLLRELAALPGLRWIRLLYCYPSYFDDALIDEIATNPKAEAGLRGVLGLGPLPTPALRLWARWGRRRAHARPHLAHHPHTRRSPTPPHHRRHYSQVCKYIDIPLQHVSNLTLLAMNRPPAAHTLALLDRLRDRVPGLALRTTFICGFPGETEEQHRELVDFCAAFKFERMGAFAYSEEDGTPAASLPGQVDPDVRAARRDELVSQQQGVGAALAEGLVGREVDVLVDGYDEDGQARGRRGARRSGGWRGLIACAARRAATAHPGAYSCPPWTPPSLPPPAHRPHAVGRPGRGPPGICGGP